MKNHTEYLKPELVVTAAKVLQALDIEAEAVFNQNHAEAVEKEIKIPESLVSDLADNIASDLPAQLLMMDGNGYRMMFSLLVNVLLAAKLEDLAMICLDSREAEM